MAVDDVNTSIFGGLGASESLSVKLRMMIVRCG